MVVLPYIPFTIFQFVQIPVKVEHFGATIVNASAPLISVIAFKTALMAVMRRDATALQMAALLAALLAVLVVSMLAEIVEKHLELKQMSTASTGEFSLTFLRCWCLNVTPWKCLESCIEIAGSRI